MHNRPLRTLVAGAALLAATVAQANLVVNGDFEIGQGDGWTLSGNTLFTVFDGLAPQSGSLAAAFGAAPADPAWLSQTLATQAGAQYRLSFWLQNGADAVPGQPNFFSVNWDGGAVEAQLDDAPAFAYREYRYLFTASSAATELRFGFGNFAGYWDFDNVAVSAVSAVPEPASALLAALGLLAVGAARRFRP